MIVEEIREELFRKQDLNYRDFICRLIPNTNPETIIGVRTPVLRKYAKQLVKREDVRDFLKALPHRYQDENSLHGLVLAEIKEFDLCLKEVNQFLPYINNWAVCDMLSPKVFQRYHQELLVYIRKWLKSEEEYTVRFAIGMLMEHFLGDDFTLEYVELVTKVHLDSYYVKMMVAWYFATGLAKQYEKILPYMEGKYLDTWTHNKTIQKALESYRITFEQKTYLRTLKVKK
ncbi:MULTISPECIES: DNA alkylation repair protein [Terrabacteria group]|uniref:DNA alkylation repair protein n=1 Tax=Bacillati TaxID=1783272 RepID=UPI001C6E9C56|nr:MULTISPECIES: DNA alkylation repair protein [Terrabacteria group]MBW9212996.1 DNA alkylation repair protein [Trueperella sp. zg.1013]